jgi:hypothetical protein
MKKTFALYVLLCLSILLASCNFPSIQQTQVVTPDSPEGVMTAVALTVAANEVATQITGGNQNTQPVQNTTEPIILASPTVQPTAQPTATNQPSATPTSIPCDRAAFVSDVTVPDGTEINKGETFTKTWRLKNNGSCTWNNNYDLVFDSGDAMSGPVDLDFTGTVAPGQTIDISVELTAPNTTGTYKGYWKLRNSSNAEFGIGLNGSNPFWVEIEVVDSGGISLLFPGVLLYLAPRYSLATAYCDAEWMSGAGSRPCPGTDSDAGGFVLRQDDPKMSDGTTLSGMALETHPQWTNNGVITGRYPDFTIEDGDHFKATIGCLQGGSACDVQFQLNYRDGSGLHNLDSWFVTYADGPQEIDVDLSSLDGKTVQIALAVLAHGPASQDWAIWYWPRITK